MKPENYYKRLEEEKEKLGRLVKDAIKNGVPLAQDEAVIAQNSKVDELVLKIQRENERQRKNRHER